MGRKQEVGGGTKQIFFPKKRFAMKNKFSNR